VPQLTKANALTDEHEQIVAMGQSARARSEAIHQEDLDETIRGKRIGVNEGSA
jgi:hypothetical protein